MCGYVCMVNLASPLSFFLSAPSTLPFFFLPLCFSPLLPSSLPQDEAHQARLRELDAITNERDTRRREFEDLRKQRLDEFMAGFSIITNKLKEMYQVCVCVCLRVRVCVCVCVCVTLRLSDLLIHFTLPQMITLGGDAELELVDSLDPFSEGIVFSVRPPKKSWKNISNLSGGEKTLSSLALVGGSQTPVMLSHTQLPWGKRRGRKEEGGGKRRGRKDVLVVEA